MSHINTDQKLELVRTIRMQNQYNRMKCRERESFLYGKPLPHDRKELYSAEAAMSFPAQPEIMEPEKSGGLLTGFRIRFLIALVLFSVFIYFDKNDISILGKNTFELFVSLTESIDLPIDLPILNSIDFR
ncbi:MAG: hypothetical protein HDR23_05290 [Lachnospiraceae bacterium]|nr:hypothetical protein [Lachnospiraceae bacterium]